MGPPPRIPSSLAPTYLVVLLCVMLLVVLRLRAGDPIGVRADSWSEANIIVSARNAVTNGWAEYHGVAEHQVDRPPFKSDPFYYYAHYPLGASWVTWVLYLWGASSLPALRWPAAICAVAAVMLWYLLLCRIVDRWTALLSSAVLATAYGFLSYADDLHHGYSNALLAAMMLSYVAGRAAHGRRRIVLMAGSWACLFINSFMSWEWYLWSQIFYWGHAVLLGTPFKKRWLLVFALAPLLGFGIQLRLRAGAFGPESGGGVAADVLRRTIEFDEATDTPPGVTLRTYPLHVLTRFVQFYGIGLPAVWCLAAVWGLLIAGWGDSLRTHRAFRWLPTAEPHPASRWIILLFLCGVSWWMVMLQHTAVHPHVMRHALFFYALVLGLFLSAGLRFIFGTGYAAWVRVLSAAALLLVVWPHTAVGYRNFRMHADAHFKDPYGWGSGDWAEAQNFADLARHLPDDAIILVNHNRLPLLRYWTNLPVYPGSLSQYPLRRGATTPGGRFRLELTLNHLKALYGDQMPRLLFVYFFRRPPLAAYADDAILWQLIDGSWANSPDATRGANFRQLLATGKATTRYPLVARGGNWIAFDASTLPANLPAQLVALPPPSRSDFGPPR